MNIYMAKDVREALGESVQKCQSISLLLDKYAILNSEWEESKRASLAMAIAGNKKWLDDQKSRAERGNNQLRTNIIREAVDGVAESRHLHSDLEQKHIDSQIHYRSSLDRVRHLCASSTAPLIVNHAGGVLENAGLCLHRFTSIPYISGSAIKGAARRAAVSRLKEQKNQDEKLSLLNTILEVFGWTKPDLASKEENDLYWAFEKDIPAMPHEEHVGGVVFLDSFPLEVPSLMIDVLACHHPKYYQGKNTHATDDENPNIQTFPAIKKGARYLFSILPVGKKSTTEVCKTSLVEAALDFLREGIEEFGIGAKTAAGYGRFRTYSVFEEPRIMKKILIPDSNNKNQQKDTTSYLDPIQQYLNDLKSGKVDPVRDFAGIKNLSPEKASTLLSFIKDRGIDKTLNPKKNEKGKRRIRDFEDVCRQILEGSDEANHS
jgi:CRISPR-associated protein Cmr6